MRIFELSWKWSSEEEYEAVEKRNFTQSKFRVEAQKFVMFRCYDMSCIEKDDLFKKDE